MYVRKVKLSPSVFLAHAKAQENSTAKYPINRVVCKTLTIPSAVMDVNQEKLFSRQIPTRIQLSKLQTEGDFRLLGRAAAAWYKTSDDRL